MKKALLVAMDSYDWYQPFDGAVQHTALELRKLLANPLFGGFQDVSLKENDQYQSFLESVGRLFDTATVKDELLFYFAGHGAKLLDGDMVLLPVNATDTDLRQCAISGHLLAGMLLSTKATKVSVILDCCHSGTFLKSVASQDIESELTSSSFATHKKSLQVLCSKDDSHVEMWRSQFTGGILDGIRTGVAGGNDISVTLEDIARYLSITKAIGRDVENHFRSFKNINKTDPEQRHIISKNPYRGRAVPRELIISLYSQDRARSEKAMRDLKNLSTRETETLDGSSPASRLLHAFLRDNGDFQQQIGQLAPEIPHGSRQEPGPREEAIQVFYHRRNEPFALEAATCFTRNDVVFWLHDLEGPLKHRGPDVLDWISRSLPTLWIVDAEFARRLRSRSPEIYRALCDTPHDRIGHRAVYWLERGSEMLSDLPLAHSRLTGNTNTPMEEFACELSRLVLPHRADLRYEAEFNPANFTSVVKKEEDFLTLLERRDEQLMLVLRRHQDLPTAHILREPPREPKFLIYERAGSYVMAIVDMDASVNEAALQYTFEPQATARLATHEELKELGFEPDRVHPMWLDPGNQISRIFIDANIFFQYLIFPLSKVILPKYHLGADHKAVSSISSFVRTLQVFHGEQKIIFGNIIQKKKLYDKTLISLLSSHHAFSRFAPTPSNSLHVGSLRTAIIAYLFSITNASLGRFHIRFDDTNVEPDMADHNIGLILKDLEWIGIPSKQHYRQTSSMAAERYNSALDLLNRSGLVAERRDGSFELRLDPNVPAFSYWLDLRHGPRVLHKAPTRSPHAQPLDYSLTWVPKKSGDVRRFKYKFAGAIDDMINNSLVVRDIRQEHSMFTARQSLFMGMVREALAFPRDPYSKNLGQQLKQSAQRRIANTGSFRPFPFPCPPTYFHVSRVVDEKGVQLSKRELRPEHTISFLRQHGTYFPETILAWCLYSLGQPFCASLGYRTLTALIKAVAPCGAHGFLYDHRDRVRPEMLWQSQQTHSIRITGLKRIDYLMLVKLPPYRLYDFAEKLYAENGINSSGETDITDSLRELALRLYERRRYFSGAGDLAAVILALRQTGKRSVPPGVEAPDDIELPHDDGRLEEWIDGFERKYYRWIRFCVCGLADGPPLRELLYVMGPLQFLTKLRDWRQHNE